MPSRQAAAESVKCAGEDPKGLMFPLLLGFRVQLRLLQGKVQALDTNTAGCFEQRVLTCSDSTLLWKLTEAFWFAADVFQAGLQKRPAPRSG